MSVCLGPIVCVPNIRLWDSTSITPELMPLDKGTTIRSRVDSDTLKGVLVDAPTDGIGLYCTSTLSEIADCNYYIVTIPDSGGQKQSS